MSNSRVDRHRSSSDRRQPEGSGSRRTESTPRPSSANAQAPPARAQAQPINTPAPPGSSQLSRNNTGLSDTSSQRVRPSIPQEPEQRLPHRASTKVSGDESRSPSRGRGKQRDLIDARSLSEQGPSRPDKSSSGTSVPPTESHPSRVKKCASAEDIARGRRSWRDIESYSKQLKRKHSPPLFQPKSINEGGKNTWFYFGYLPNELKLEVISHLPAEEIKGPLQNVSVTFREFVKSGMKTIIRKKEEHQAFRLHTYLSYHDYKGIPFFTALGRWTKQKGLWMDKNMSILSTEMFVRYYARDQGKTDKDDRGHLDLLAVRLVKLYLVSHTKSKGQRTVDLIKDIKDLHDFPRYAQVGRLQQYWEEVMKNRDVFLKPGKAAYRDDLPSPWKFLTALNWKVDKHNDKDIPGHPGKDPTKRIFQDGLPSLPVGFAYYVTNQQVWQRILDIAVLSDVRATDQLSKAELLEEVFIY